MGRTLKVVVDQELCEGTQSCVFTAPGVFERTEDGRTIVLDPAAASEEEVVDAALNCPFEAISVTDAETGENLVV
jgi:ferredoxin